MHSRLDTDRETQRGAGTRNWSDALRGRTLRLSFHEGPTRGASYDHTFHGDDTLSWRDSAVSKLADSPAAGEAPTRYRSFQVADEVYVVSYLTKSGYTLTVALNFETDEIYGFTSNGQHWHPVRGNFEILR